MIHFRCNYTWKLGPGRLEEADWLEAHLGDSGSRAWAWLRTIPTTTASFPARKQKRLRRRSLTTCEVWAVHTPPSLRLVLHPLVPFDRLDVPVSEEGTQLSIWVIRLHLLLTIWTARVNPTFLTVTNTLKKPWKLTPHCSKTFFMTVTWDKNSGTPWWLSDWKEFFFHSYLWPRLFFRIPTLSLQNIKAFL